MVATQSDKIELRVGDERLAGTFLHPAAKVPGVLFVHGWGSSQQSDLARARGVAGLGCVCMTFDLRGHEKTRAERLRVSREDNLRDVLAARDARQAGPTAPPEGLCLIEVGYPADPFA